MTKQPSSSAAAQRDIQTPAQRHSSDPAAGNPAAQSPKRINVAVNAETIEALQKVIEREGVTLTEAVRRLIGYGEVLYRAVKEENAEVLLKSGQNTKQVIIL
ncbi:ribbon-helix-helix protein, CopG family [Amycolatopsis sp. NPDC048633]|uniref:ribbon-helix-helix protein, CopG family n=1 Tax=Amycolatopsis sp. NPDC048633 TaxID=3157095 RepID=UPI0033FA3DF4